MGRVFVAGSINMDVVATASRHPRVGETVAGEAVHYFPGGKGANQAVAAARLGAPVRMIGRVGPDAFGETLLATARRDGVDTTHVRRDETAATGVALITVADSGQNTIVVAPGANGQVTPADVDAAAEAFAGAAVLLVQLECPLPAVIRAAQLARDRQALVVLNPAPARPLPEALLKLTDLLAPNESELAALAGGADVAAGAAQLRAAGVRTVIVTRGERGVYYESADARGELPAHPVPVVDTTAAGDAFLGGLAVALAEGRPLAEAVAWGNAAGALAVTRPGAQPSLPTAREFHAFLKERTP